MFTQSVSIWVRPYVVYGSGEDTHVVPERGRAAMHGTSLLCVSPLLFHLHSYLERRALPLLPNSQRTQGGEFTHMPNYQCHEVCALHTSLILSWQQLYEVWSVIWILPYQALAGKVNFLEWHSSWEAEIQAHLSSLDRWEDSTLSGLTWHTNDPTRRLQGNGNSPGYLMECPVTKASFK